MAGLLLLLALGVQMAIMRLLDYGKLNFTLLAASYYKLLSYWGPPEAFLSSAICLGAAFLLAWRVDVNEFSMHNFYENRLVRCYLGASRLKRYPNRFTGFDPDDDVRVADLSPMPASPASPDMPARILC